MTGLGQFATQRSHNTKQVLYIHIHTHTFSSPPDLEKNKFQLLEKT